ncbi:DNA-3-methyladenine glycosylase 2 family protein [Paenibacillus sp. ACRRX]|uniref:DNA-3-methyladenine glycosylase family protein n=1 Tax=Paenibacillus sp. ACRRX TaxID=2918206 RepID=UPI001EF719D9|nr:DNA-3-methyladenine glycosylase 2 family protein [Paenibacillus sp. ACRRX]MCG7409423.1 DNA-3-methyladenine glycosylase 2 family protein [Paenibacillus sp. ACRRX]
MNRVVTKFYEYGQNEIDYLKQKDEILGRAIDRLGKVEREIIPDLFSALVHAIVGQLVSVKAVHTVWDRMQERLGEITPENITRQSTDDIQKCGMTMKKAVCIHSIAETITTGKWDIETLRDLPDDEVIRQLTTLNGIGRWTAEMLLINSMERRDVVSWGDIAIRRGIMKLYSLSDLSKVEFEQYRRKYSPFGSVASLYLWVISFE